MCNDNTITAAAAEATLSRPSTYNKGMHCNK